MSQCPLYLPGTKMLLQGQRDTPWWPEHFMAHGWFPSCRVCWVTCEPQGFIEHLLRARGWDTEMEKVRPCLRERSLEGSAREAGRAFLMEEHIWVRKFQSAVGILYSCIKAE